MARMYPVQHERIGFSPHFSTSSVAKAMATVVRLECQGRVSRQTGAFFPSRFTASEVLQACLPPSLSCTRAVSQLKTPSDGR